MSKLMGAPRMRGEEQLRWEDEMRAFSKEVRKVTIRAQQLVPVSVAVAEEAVEGRLGVRITVSTQTRDAGYVFKSWFFDRDKMNARSARVVWLPAMIWDVAQITMEKLIPLCK